MAAVVPGVPVLAVILADGPPLALAEVGAPSPPAGPAFDLPPSVDGRSSAHRISLPPACRVFCRAAWSAVSVREGRPEAEMTGDAHGVPVRTGSRPTRGATGPRCPLVTPAWGLLRIPSRPPSRRTRGRRAPATARRSWFCPESCASPSRSGPPRCDSPGNPGRGGLTLSRFPRRRSQRAEAPIGAEALAARIRWRPRRAGGRAPLAATSGA